jgi:hypothetical protein
VRAVRDWLRRNRWIALAVLAVALAALIAALTVPHAKDDRRLGADNAAPNGGRALVQVLRRQGVDVRAVQLSTDVVADTNPQATVLVTDPGLLGTQQLDRLAGTDARDLVLVEPDEYTLSRLAPMLRTAGVAPARSSGPNCSVPAAVTAGSVRAGGRLYQIGLQDNQVSSAVCYPQRAGTGSYAVARTPTRLITVIGQSDLLTNEYLGRQGNAALAMTTLGQQPELIWYVPDPLESAAQSPQPSLGDLLPDWVVWVIVQLVVVAAIVILWRARRLGRLITEPLPVLVRAAETQEGRARLYRQASARGRAAATLRTTTLRRLAARLAASAGTTPRQVVAMTAEATGRSEAGVHTLLLGPTPASDSALVNLADELDTLERALAHPPGTPSAPPTARPDLKGSLH